MSFEQFPKLFEVYDREPSKDNQMFYEFEGAPEPERVAKFNQERIAYQTHVMRKGASNPDVERFEDFTYQNGDYIGKISVYRPKGQEGILPAAVYVHGGGWFNLSKECFEYECSFIAQKSECVVFSIEYRLAIGGIKLPTPQEDAYAALLEIVKQAEVYGADGSKFVVMGDSAGGEMAAALSILSRERGGPDIIAQILCYPCVGFEETQGQEEVDSLIPLIFPVEGREELMNRPYISPILDPCIHKTPPTMLIIGTCDFLLDDVLRYARKLMDAGVEVDFRLYQGMIHGFIQMGTAPGLDSLQQISCKLKEIYC